MLLANSKIFCNVSGSQLAFNETGTAKTSQGNSISLSPVPTIKFSTPARPKKFSTSDQATSSKDVAELSPTKSQHDEKPRSNLICKGRNEKLESCNQCPYWHQHKNLPVKTNSENLRNNYDAAKTHDSYDIYFDSEVAPLKFEKGWRVAAHHIISGNQVFKTFPELVKLAELCRYDINCYENCIMLIGAPKDYGKHNEAQTIKAAKIADADEVMRESRLQWHVSHHQFSFTKEEAVLIRRNFTAYLSKRKNIQTPEIACYAELVKTDVESLIETLKKENACFFKNPQLFVERMNELSSRIKKMLAAFRDKPQHSYPYFVSKEAYLYAFGVPRTTKFFLVSQERGTIQFTLVRATRYRKILQDESQGLAFELKERFAFNSKNLNGCLMFIACSVFFLLDNIRAEELHFLKPASEKNGTAYFLQLTRNRNESDEFFLQRNGRQILAWLRESVGDWENRNQSLGAVGITNIRKRLENQ